MKKLACSLLTIIILFTISCEIGLGSSVDTDPPTLVIDGNIADTVIRDDFALRGTYSDDGVINSLKAVLKRTDNTGEPISFTGTIIEIPKKRGTGTWTIDVPAKTNSIKDGTYQADVSITDGLGRITTQSTIFTIDNTPPIIILTRPSTSIQSTSSPDTYGQKLSIKGTAAETNNISRMEIQLYSDEACTEVATLEPIVLKNVPGSIELDAASYDVDKSTYVFEGVTQKFDLDVPTDGDGKTFYYKLFAYDGAKRYLPEDVTPTDDDLKGNRAEYFFLHKDIYEAIVQHYTTTELYSILSDTFTETKTDRAADAPLPDKVKEDLLRTDETKENDEDPVYQRSIGIFTLNPKNNPTYTLTGRSPLADSGTKAAFDSDESELVSGGQLIIEVAPGLDGHTLKEDTIKIYTQRRTFNNDGTPSDSPKVYLEQDDYTQTISGDAYKIILPISRDMGYDIGGYYFVGVEGKDVKGNAIVSVGNNPYGFKLISSGRIPSITVQSDYKYRHKDLDFTNTIKVSSTEAPYKLYRQVVVDGEEYDETANSNDTDHLKYKLIGEIDGSNLTYEDKIKIGDYAADKDILVYYKVTDASDQQSIPQSIELKVDNDATTPEIKAPNGRTGTKALTETTQVTGRLIDDKAGVVKIFYKFTNEEDPGTLKGQEGGYTEEEASTGSFAIDRTFVSGLEAGENELCEGKWFFHVYSEDGAGNISGIATREFDIDMETPVITTVLDSSDLSANTPQKRNKAYTFGFKITESNRLNATNPVLITVKKGSTELDASAYTIKEGATTKTVSEIVAGKDYTIEIPNQTDELYTYTIKVKDFVGKEATVERKVQFDTTPPVAKHEIDDSSKDIYFRIGDYSNDAGESDVGGKYQNGTYGNALTIQIRGYFADTEGGSGINKYYYKTFNNQEVVVDATKNYDSVTVEQPYLVGSGTEAGQIFFETADSLKNYVITNTNTDNSGTFYPLENAEPKNVEYNILPANKDNPNKNLGGEKTNGDTVASNGYVQFRKQVYSNYKATIKGFQEGKNFLVLVAEDNVGNTTIDYAEVPGVGTFYCYSLNVDVTTPSIPTKEDDNVFTNIDYTETDPNVHFYIEGTVSDKSNSENSSSGIASIVFTRDGANGSISITNNDLTAPTSEDIAAVPDDPTLKHWKVDVKSLLPSSGTAIISAKVKDKVGAEISVPVASITVDRIPPEVMINSPSANAMIGATALIINGTANDGSGAGLSSESLKVYYTKSDNLGTATTAPASTAFGTDLDENWVELGEVTSNAIWTFTKPSIESVAPDGENTTLYFIVSAKDNSGTGNVGYSAPRKVTVDRKAPAFVSGSFNGNATTSTDTWLNNRTVNIQGSFTDTFDNVAGSGVNSIHYKVYETGTNPSLALERVIPTTDGSYNTNVELDENVTNTTFDLWAIDAAGNISTTKTYTVKVDNTEPSLSAEYYKKGSDDFAEPGSIIYIKSQTVGTNFVLYGNYNDGSNQSGVKELVFKKNGTAFASNAIEVTYSTTEITGTDSIASATFAAYNSESAGSYKSWKASFSLNETARITVEGEDLAGNKATSVSALDVTFDNHNPELSNVNFTETKANVTEEVYSSGSGDSVTYFINNTDTSKTFTISGIATDNIGLQTITLDVVNAASSTTFLTTQTLNNPTGNWSFTVGDWSGWSTGAIATVKVKDKAGNEATASLNIQFDTVAPSLSTDDSKFVTPTANQTESSLFKFEGLADSVVHGSTGSGFDKVDIAFTASNTQPTAAYTSANIASNGSWSSTIEFENVSAFTTQGTKYLWVRAYDHAGNVSSWRSKSFEYDTEAPSLSFITPTPADNSYTKQGFTLKVEADDSNGVDAVTVSYGTQTAVPLTLNASGQYEKEFTVGSSEGSLTDNTYNFTVTVTDISGKTKSITRTIIVDTTAPTGEFAATSPAGNLVAENRWYKVSSIRFAVDITEANISTVEISKDASTYEAMNVSNGSYIANVTGLSEGSNTVTVKMTDLAGNENTVSQTVYVDTTDPTLTPTESTILKYMGTGGFTVSGTASDNSSGSGIDTLTVKQEYNSGSSWDDPDTDAITISGSSWSTSLPLGELADNGQYRYTFTLKDKAGNEKSYQFTTTVDQTAPTLSFTNPTGKTETNAINASPYMFSGNVVEANEIKAIYYKILSDTATAPTAPANVISATAWAGWTSVTPEENWSFYRNINIGSDAIAEGKYKIYMYALDGAGNLSERASQEFHVDMAAPVVTANAPEYVNYATDSTNHSKTVAINGTVTESQLDTFYIKRNDESGSGTAVTPEEDGSWSYENTPTANGTYTYTFTATDKVGKTNATLTKTVIVDTTAPAISELKVSNSVLAADADTSNAWYKSQIIPLSVAVVEEDSGIASVEWVTQTSSETAALTTSDWAALTTIDSEGKYTGSAIFDTIGTGQKLYIRVTDKAGNISYFKDNNAAVTINIDTTAPDVTPPENTSFATNGTGNNITVSGTAVDNESGIENVVVTVGGLSGYSQTITTFTGTGTTWTAEVPVTSFTSGTIGDFTIYAKATNKAGIAGSQVSVGTISVDTTRPTITISSPAANAIVGAANLSIIGTASDGTGSGLSIDSSDKITLYYTKATPNTSGEGIIQYTTVSGSTVISGITTGNNVAENWVALENPLDTDATWSTVKNIPTSVAASNANTELYFIASVKDNAGNTGYSSPRKVTVDCLAPVFGSGTINGNENSTGWFNSRTLNIVGTFNDPSTESVTGSGVTTIKYRVGNGAIQTLPTVGGSYNTNITLPDDITEAQLKIWAVDAAGNEMSEENYKTYSLQIDTMSPTLVAKYYNKGGNNTAISGTVYVKGSTNVTLYGNYSDGNGGSGVTQLTFKDKNGGSLSPVVTYSTDEISGTDGTVPTNYGTYSSSVKSWKAVFTNIGAGAITAEGIDNAGNKVSITAIDIAVDTEAPEITISSPAASAKVGAKNFIMNGITSDGTGSGLSSETMTVYYTKSEALGNVETAPTSLTIGTTASEASSKWISLGTVSSGVTWTFTQAQIADDIAASDANTDIYFTISASDKAGNIGYAVPRKITVDRKLPEVDDEPDGFGDGLAWVNRSTISFEGSFKDEGGSGANTIYYLIGDVIDATHQPGVIPTTDGRYNTNITVTTNGSNVPVHIWAKDNAGNDYIDTINTVEGVKTLPTEDSDNHHVYYVKLDASAPTIESKYFKKGNDGDLTATSDSVYVTGGTTITLYGNYEDGTYTDGVTNESGVRALTFKNNGTEFTPTSIEYSVNKITSTDGTVPADDTYVTYSETDPNPKKYRSWKAVFDIDSTNSRITVEGKDLAGNAVTETVLDIKVDTDAPTVEITSPVANAKVGATSLIINGTASDGTGSGIPSGSIPVYYTKSSTLGNVETAPTSLTIGTTASDASSKWISLGSAISNGATWTFTQNTIDEDIAPQNDNTVLYFTVASTDKAGNVGYSVPRKITVDRKTPTFVTGTVGGNATGWFMSRTVNLSGSFTDDNETGSGVDLIKYQINSGTVQDLPATSAIDTTRDNIRIGKYNTNITLDEGVTTANLKIWAVDKVGNEIPSTDTTNYKTYTLHLDTNEPKVEEWVDTGRVAGYFNDSTLTNRHNGNKTFYFYVTDVHGESGINEETPAISVKVGSHPITFGTDGNGSTLTIGTKVEGTPDKWPVTLVITEADMENLTGNNTVLVTATDEAGNIGLATSVGSLSVDITPPSITVNDLEDKNTSESETYINGKVSISGSISEANLFEETTSTSNGVTTTTENMKLYYTRAASLATTAANIDTTETPNPDSKWVEIGTAVHGITWTFADVDTTTLEKTYGANEAHRTTVYFMVSANDKAGNTGYSTPKTVIIDQDTDRPVITLSQIERKTATNETTLKTNNVYGSITDDDGNVNKLWYKFGTAPTSLPTLSGTTWTATGWTEIPVNGSSWSIESNENDGETTWYFAVADAQNKVFATKGTDKFVQPYIKYLNDTNKYDGTSAGISFKYDTNPPSASYLGLYRAPTGTTTVASDIEAEIEADSNKSWLTDNDIAFGGDYNVLYAKVIVSESTGMKALTGSGTTAPTSSPIAINYTNSSGANPLTFNKIHQVIGEDEDAGTYTYYLGPIIMDTSNKPDFKVTVTDAVGNNGYISRNIIVDNTAPNTISGAKPNSSVEQTGTFVYRGNVYDKDNNTGSELSGVKKIEWYIPKSSETSATADDITWTEATLTAGWEIDFSGNNTLSTLIDYDVSGDTSHVGDDYTAYQTASTSGIYLVPVWFKITDKVGNVGYNTTNKIRYNPNTDRPSVRITSPEHNTQATINGNTIDYAIMGGATARISGSADDDEGIGKVYLQFDLNGDGIWDNGISGYNAETANAVPDADTATCIDGCPWAVSEIKAITYNNNGTHTWGYGIEVGSSKNWSYTVNLSSTALPHITETETNGVYTYSGNTIKVRAIVVDNDEVNGQLVSAPSEVVNISVNNDIPLFSNLKLKQYDGDDVITELDYTLGKYLKGENWFITSDVQSAGGIYTASYTGTTTVANAVANDEDSYFTQKAGSTDQFEMKIPIEPNNKGEWSVIITVKDGSDDHNPNNQTITVNVDNTAPSFNDTYSNTEDIATYGTAKHYLGGYGTRGTLLTPTAKIADSDGRASIWGKVSDSGSGFEKAVFYFKRFGQNGTDNPRVYNPMEANRADIVATKTVGKVYINAEALPALYVKSDTTAGLTVSRPDVNKIKVEKDDDAPDGILGVVGNTNVHKGGLIKIGGVYRTIIDVASDGTITWSMTSSCDTSFEEAEIIYAMVLDSTGETMTGDTINEEDDDGMMENFTTSGAITTWNAALPTSNIPDGTIELHVVVFDVAGNSDHAYTKTGIENNPLRITKVMLGTDLNGNGSYGTNEYESYYAITSNSGTHTLSSGKQVWNLETRSDEHDPYFTVKSGLSVIPEFVGGTGDVYYKFKKTAASEQNPNLTTAETLTASDSNKVGTATVTAEGTGNKIGQFALANNTIGTSGDDTDYVFSFSFWDSTESSTPGTNSSWTVLNAKVHQDLTDGVVPAGDITPFYWESKTVNSVVWSNGSNPVAQGHIELENDLPTTTFASASTSGEYDCDPKVSGKIKVEGYAYDDTRLGSITVTFANKSATANYSPTNGWTYTNSTAGEYELSVGAGDGPTQNGHKVRWTLTVNTATVVTGAVAALDKEIKVTVTDANDNSYTSTPATPATGKTVASKTWSAAKAESCATSRYYTDEALTTLATNSTAAGATVYYNKTPYYKVDVVPYITKISTDVRSASGLKDNNIRSASGKYSILANNASNVITVSGFNFASGNNLKAKIAQAKPANAPITSYGTGLTATTADTADTVTTSTVRALTITQTSTTAATITNSGITKSGYLELFSNGVRTLNNINDNNSYGSAKNSSNVQITGTNAVVSDYEKAYNREPDYYTTKNVQLTDDRYLRFFDMKDTGDRTKNGAYPTMFMEGDDPVFGYFNPSGGPAGAYGDGAGTGAGYNRNLANSTNNTYPEYAMPQRIKFNSDGTEVYTEYLAKNSAGDQMGTGRDDSGRYYHMSVFNRGGCALYMIYDRYNEFYAKMGWAPGVQIGTPDNLVVSSGNNGIGLETINYGGLLAGRYQYPKIIAKGNSITGTAYVYVAYYDDYYHSIVMRNFRVGSGVTGTGTYALDSSNKDLNGRTYAQRINFAENPTNRDNNSYDNGRLSGVGTIAGEPSSTAAASKYFDMKVTSDYHIILVYYDETTSSLKLRYSTNEVIGNNPTSAIDWTDNTVQFPEYVGNYISLDLDSNNGLHMAAYDATDGNLVYMYLQSYSSTDLTKVTVDQASSVGYWTQIKVNSNNVPYIAYYNSTENGSRDGIKLAYANNVTGSIVDGVDVVPGTISGTGYTLGGWEYMTVPSVKPAQGGNPNFQNVCLGFDTSGIPVVGYSATNLEFGKALGE